MKAGHSNSLRCAFLTNSLDVRSPLSTCILAMKTSSRWSCRKRLSSPQIPSKTILRRLHRVGVHAQKFKRRIKVALHPCKKVRVKILRLRLSSYSGWCLQARRASSSTSLSRTPRILGRRLSLTLTRRKYSLKTNSATSTLLNKIRAILRMRNKNLCLLSPNLSIKQSQSYSRLLV